MVLKEPKAQNLFDIGETDLPIHPQKAWFGGHWEELVKGHRYPTPHHTEQEDTALSKEVLSLREELHQNRITLQMSMAQLTSRIDAIQKKLIEIDEELKGGYIASPLFLYDLNSDKFNLKTPLPGVLEAYNDGFVARIPEFNLWAEDNVESVAINNLKDQVSEFYQQLKDTPEEALGRLLQRARLFLSKVIQEVAQT